MSNNMTEFQSLPPICFVYTFGEIAPRILDVHDLVHIIVALRGFEPAFFSEDFNYFRRNNYCTFVSCNFKNLPIPIDWKFLRFVYQVCIIRNIVLFSFAQSSLSSRFSASDETELSMSKKSKNVSTFVFEIWMKKSSILL